MPTPEPPVGRQHNPPPWETTPTIDQCRPAPPGLDRQVRRRRIPLIGSLLAARDYRRSVKTVYSGGFDSADIDSRPDATLLHTYDADLNKHLTLDYGYDQLDRDFPDFAQDFSAFDQESRRLDPAAGMSDPVLDAVHGPEWIVDLRLQDLADEMLAAQRAGDHQHVQDIRRVLTPDRLDRLIGGYPGDWLGPDQTDDGRWSWTDRATHVGDAGVFADPAARATRDYINHVRVEQAAGRPSPIDADHADHSKYLLRGRHYQDLLEAQECRDADRAGLFAGEIRTWAATHHLHVTVDDSDHDGSIALSAATTAERDATLHTLAEIRKRHAPDHLALAAAARDFRFTPHSESARFDDRLATLYRAVDTGDEPTMRAMRATLPPDQADAVEIQRTRDALHAVPDRLITQSGLDRARITPDHLDKVLAVGIDQPTSSATATLRPEDKLADRPLSQVNTGSIPADPAASKRRDEHRRMDRTKAADPEEPTHVSIYAADSRSRQSATLLVNPGDDTSTTHHNDDDLFIDDDQTLAAASSRPGLDRDEPQASRGRAENAATVHQPSDAPSPAEPAHRHTTGAHRGIDVDPEPPSDVSPDVRQVQGAVMTHLAHRRDVPAADESPPVRHLHSAGMEI